jgi:hypothetical protein
LNYEGELAKRKILLHKINVSATFKYLLRGGGGEIRTHGRIASTTVFKTAAFNRSATPPKERAEEVGLEPTNRFLHGYSLANCWLAIRRTPPKLSLNYHFIFFPSI